MWSEQTLKKKSHAILFLLLRFVTLISNRYRLGLNYIGEIENIIDFISEERVWVEDYLSQFSFQQLIFWCWDDFYFPMHPSKISGNLWNCPATEKVRVLCSELVKSQGPLSIILVLPPVIHFHNIFEWYFFFSWYLQLYMLLSKITLKCILNQKVSILVTFRSLSV